MKSQKLNEFRYLRNMAIIFVVRENPLTMQNVLQMDTNRTPEFSSNQMSILFEEYLPLRNALHPESSLLFPTDEGKKLLPEKFKQNLTRLLREAGFPKTSCNPITLTRDHIEKLLSLKFSYQRPSFQISLAAGLLGYQALRPNEVAKLKKSDILLSEEIIILRDTKSREDQSIIIYPDLMKPLMNYLEHIGADEPLFVRESNQQWERKDVYRAIRNFGQYYGFKQINPRRFRSTVANYMINANIPIKLVSKYLRHKDIATTLRHYLEAAGFNETRVATKLLHSLLSEQANERRDATKSIHSLLSKKASDLDNDDSSEFKVQ